MKDCIYITSPKWTEFLRRTPIQQDVNLWSGDKRWGRKSLEPGAYFYFVHTKSRSLIGRGRLVRSEIRTGSEAWDCFGRGNGAPTLESAESLMSEVLKIDNPLDAEMRCWVLDNIEWLSDEGAYGLSEKDFGKPVQVGKHFSRGEKPDLEGLFESASPDGFVRVWEEGAPLEANFRVECLNEKLSVLFQSGGGAPRGGVGRKRNPDYVKGLELLLMRLANLEALLSRVEIETAATRNLSAKDRRLDLVDYPFPVDLSLVDDFSKFRKAISKSAARTGTRTISGGNGRKQIRLYVDLPQPEFQQRDWLQRSLERKSEPDGGSRVQRPTDGEEQERKNAAVVGRKGEIHFLKWSRQELEKWGDPDDKTDSVGLGYDVGFPDVKKFVEVKGFRAALGPIRLTEREWKTARQRRESYYLALVAHLDESKHTVDLVKDPWGQLDRFAEKSARLQITFKVPGQAVRDVVPDS